VSARGEQAAATLVRLGLDPEAVRAGRIGAEAVAPLLAGADGAALAAALGELASAEVAALLLALEPRAGERAVRKEIRRALYRLRQRGVPVPAPPAPAAAFEWSFFEPLACLFGDMDGERPTFSQKRPCRLPHSVRPRKAALPSPR